MLTAPFAACCMPPLQLLSQVMGSIPNTSSVRLVNASVRGADAARLTAALLQCGSLRTLQLHQVGCCKNALLTGDQLFFRCMLNAWCLCWGVLANDVLLSCWSGMQLEGQVVQLLC